MVGVYSNLLLLPSLLPRSLSKLPFQMLSESPTGTCSPSPPPTCGSFLFTPLSLPPAADTPPPNTLSAPKAADRRVTRDTPVHQLKGTFMEIF